MTLALPALLASVLSALALYAGSAHGRIAWLAWLRRAGTVAGLSLAAIALALWIAALGVGAGLCTMLASWMLAAMAIPYLASLPEATRGAPR